jgi:hypothetical protein
MQLQILCLALAPFVAALDCATAPKGNLNRLFWVTETIDDRAIWADGANSTVYGSELSYETKNTWDFIFGTTQAKRKFCHRFFRANPDGSNRQYLGGLKEQAVESLYAYPSKGYLFVQEYNKTISKREFQLLSTTSGEVYTRLPYFESFGDAVPSPSGDLIAIASMVIDQVTLLNTTVTITFYTPQGVPVGVQSVVEFPEVPVATWNNNGEFLLVQGSKSVAITPFSTTDASVPNCVVPKTTSTETSLSGLVLGQASNGRFEIVNTVGPENIFGCQ